MRTLTPQQETYVETVTNAPLQATVVALLIETGTSNWIRLTNADGDITLGSVVYTSSRVVAKVGAVRDGSEMTGSLWLPDEDQAFSALIATYGWSEKECWIGAISGGAGTYAAEDAEWIFTGYTSDYEDEFNALLLGLVETNADDGYTGRVPIDEVFRHAPVPGTRVHVLNTGNVFTIERSPA